MLLIAHCHDTRLLLTLQWKTSTNCASDGSSLWFLLLVTKRGSAGSNPVRDTCWWSSQRRSSVQLTCDAGQKIIWLQTVRNIICDLSTEREPDDVNVHTARISDTIHELSRALTNMFYAMNDSRIAKARWQVEPVDKEHVVRIAPEIFWWLMMGAC